jgi:hypothetical protein
MNADLYSPAKYFMRPLIFRERQFAVRCPARYGLWFAVIVFFLIPCDRLTAQQAAIAASPGLSSGIAQASNGFGSSVKTQSLDAAASAEAGTTDSSSAPDDATYTDNPQQSAQKDAPAPQSPSDRDPQTRRILGIIPNFRAISTDEKLPAQSVKEKFVTATEDSFDYSSVFIPLALAGYSQLTNATPEFGTGGVAYGRYLWHAAVDQTSENYMVEFVVPVVTHEDTRYYTLGRGGFWKRSGYALSRAVVTRSDSGKEVFNASEVIGAGAAAGLSSLYYPAQERSFGNTGKEWGLDVGIDAASFVAKEFWPDINHWLFHAAKPSAATTQ